MILQDKQTMIMMKRVITNRRKVVMPVGRRKKEKQKKPFKFAIHFSKRFEKKPKKKKLNEIK